MLTKKNILKEKQNYDCEFLYHEIAKKTLERIEETKNKKNNILIIGQRDGFLEKRLQTQDVKVTKSQDIFSINVENKFDVIIFNHILELNADNLEEFFKKAKQSLKEDAFIIGSNFVFQEIDIEKIGNLMSQLNFLDVITDRDKIKVSYGDIKKLEKDLLEMGTSYYPNVENRGDILIAHFENFFFCGWG